MQLAEISSAHRRTLLQTWRGALADREFQQRCDAVLAKIVALGPIGSRDLCRTFGEQRMGRLAPVLSQLIKTGEILKRHDGRFDIPERWLSRLRVEIC